MAKEVKISRVALIEPDGGGFHIVLVSGDKKIELHASRHVLLAGVEMARLALAKPPCGKVLAIDRRGG